MESGSGQLHGGSLRPVGYAGLCLPPDVTLCVLTCRPDSAALDLELLTKREQSRAQAITHAKQQALFVLGRRAARTLLAERLGVPPREVPLRVAADGAVVVEGSDLRLSISHSGNHAVAVAGFRPIGVDIEQIRPRRDGLIQRILHEDEWPAFEANPIDHVRKVILYWTLKEAALKAMRTGLTRPPSALRLDIDYLACEGVIYSRREPILRARFAEYQGYWIGVAFVPRTQTGD